MDRVQMACKERAKLKKAKYREWNESVDPGGYCRLACEVIPGYAAHLRHLIFHPDKSTTSGVKGADDA